MRTNTYMTLDRMWRSTCKIMFGEDVGELSDYAEWLAKDIVSVKARKSAVSGKDVYFAIKDYCDDAKFMSIDEVNFSRRYGMPLDINEIKDIDSITEAFKERFAYAGSVILMNSRDVEASSNIQNSFHILGSTFIYDSEYMAYCTYSRYSKSQFGTIHDSNSSFLVKAYVTDKDARCLEVMNTLSCSDCCYSVGLEGVQNALFCFNLRSRYNMIGNLELPRDKFAELRTKLLAEIRDELKRNKSLPSIVELALGSKKKPKIPKIEFNEKEEITDKAPVEKAFRETTKIVLGKDLSGLDAYGKWLSRGIPEVKAVPSAATGKAVYLARVIDPYEQFPKDRIVRSGECAALGEAMNMDEKDLSSLETIRENIGKIALFTPELEMGDNRNLISTPMANSCSNCYSNPALSNNEYCAFSHWPRNSKYIFGSNLALSSNFCIRSNYSANLSRSFEVDSCSGCSDIYYSHNCENVHDSMFCFNVKNLKNAIGNAVLKPESYKEIKKSILEQIVSELEKKKDLEWSIYNIACGGK
jgi:hypothetical protein